MMRINQKINKVVGFILILLMSLIVLDVSWQVFSRFILKSPSSYTEELAGFLLIWIGILGAGYAYFTRAHLAIEIISGRLKGPGKQIIDFLISLMVLLFAFFIMVLGGLNLVYLTITLKQISPALKIPMGFVYLVIPLTGILIILYAVGFMSANKNQGAYGE